MIFNKLNFFISRLAPKSGSGPYYGVHVTEKCTEVTNGHYAVRVACVPEAKRDELPVVSSAKPIKGRKFSAMISTESAGQLEKLPATKVPYGVPVATWVWLGRGSNEKETQFITTDLESTRATTVRNMDGKFPDMDKVIKDYGLNRKPRASIGLNAKYLRDMCNLLIQGGETEVWLRWFSANKPVMMKSKKEGQAITIILMGIKGEDRKKEKPAPEKEAAAAEEQGAPLGEDEESEGTDKSENSG